jgi:Calx-beta domain-containing protein
VDHQNGDGNQFELYRKGEWLTKERTGYDLDYGGSNDHNTLCLENDPPDHNDFDTYRNIQWRLGSQWTYVSSADPQLLATSFGPGFVYALGDATNLYNSVNENSTDILHASRSIVWLQPDHVVVYDRAASQTAGRFKRFWLNTPTLPSISGNLATVTTASGRRLYVTAVLPAGASISAQPFQPLCPPCGNLAVDEPMGYQLRVEATGGPTTARFLHVLQGADAGMGADTVTLVQSASGTPFSGVVVRSTAVLFPVDLAVPFTGVTFTVPLAATAQLITGLAPSAGYTVTSAPAGGGVQFTVAPGGTSAFTDAGGVLALPQVSFSIDDVSVGKPSSGTATAVFTVSLSSPVAQTATVAFATADGTATAGLDYSATAGTLVFAAGETSRTVAVPVLADRVAGSTQTFFVNLSSPGGAVMGKTRGVGTILNPNPAGLSIDDVRVVRSANSSVDAVFTVTLAPTSGSTVTVDYATADGTGVAGTDYASTSGTLSFAPGAATQPITVTALPRPLGNPPRTFLVNLANPGGAAIAYAQGTGTIVSPGSFFRLSPCRLLDTRYPTSPLGGPALSPGADRTFTLVGVCGIPPTAKAVSVNLAVTQPSAQGNVRLYPGGSALPNVSAINYVAGQTRANNAIVLLGAGGQVVAHSVQGFGTVHLILDVNGYFE